MCDLPPVYCLFQNLHPPEKTLCISQKLTVANISVTTSVILCSTPISNARTWSDFSLHGTYLCYPSHWEGIEMMKIQNSWMKFERRKEKQCWVERGEYTVLAVEGWNRSGKQFLKWGNSELKTKVSKGRGRGTRGLEERNSRVNVMGNWRGYGEKRKSARNFR